MLTSTFATLKCVMIFRLRDLESRISVVKFRNVLVVPEVASIS